MSETRSPTGPDATTSDRRRDDEPRRPERDLGDSAGYGSGGSTLDYHEVGDEDGTTVGGRPNPLDAVVRIKNPIKP